MVGTLPARTMSEGRQSASAPTAMTISGEVVGAVSLACLARSEEHTSELQSLMRISYAVFCLKKQNKLVQTISKINKNKRIIHHFSNVYYLYDDAVQYTQTIPYTVLQHY